MRLTILGSGTSQISKHRSSPGYLLQADNQKMALDLGQGSLRRLLQAGHRPDELTAVFISHHHLDHMADLLPLLFGLNYDPVLSAKAEIDLLASTGFAKVLESLGRAYGAWIDPQAPRLRKHFIEPGGDVLQGGVRIATAKARHIDTSIAFRFEHGGKSLVYLGDSAYSEQVAELSSGADLLIAHIGDRGMQTEPTHLNPKTAGRLAKEAKVGTLLLSHLYGDMDASKAQDIAGLEYSGRIKVAEDLLVMDI